MLGLSAVAAAMGARQVKRFSAQVDALRGVATKDAEPKLIDARTDIWFDPEDVGLRRFKDVEKEFIPEDIVLIAFEEPNAKWGVFSPRALAAIAKLTKKIQEVPYVRHVRSLTASPWIRWDAIGADDEGLVVTDLFERAPARYSSDERLKRMVAVLGAERASRVAGRAAVRRLLGKDARFEDHVGEPRLVHGVVSEHARIGAIQVQLLRPQLEDKKLKTIFGHDSESARIAPALVANDAQWGALDQIRTILANDRSGYRFHMTGMPVFEQNQLYTGQKDMMFVGAMLAVIALALMCIFRRFSGVAIPMLIVGTSIAGMLGSIWWSGDLLNNLTAIAPVIVTAIGVADSVHLLVMYFELRPKYSDRQTLVTEVVRRNALPVFLTSITTAAGFFSLTISEIIPLQMLGYTGGLGAILAYLVTMAVMPAALSALPLSKKSASNTETESETRASERLVPWILKHRAAIVGSSLVVVGVSALGMSRVEIDSNFVNWFHPDNPVITDLKWIEKHLTGSADLEIVFYGAKSNTSVDAAERRAHRIEQLELKQLGQKTLTAQEQREFAKLRRDERRDERGRIAVSERFLGQVARFERRIIEEAKDPNSPISLVTKMESALDVLRKVHFVQHQNQARYFTLPTSADVPREARRPSVIFDEMTEEPMVIPAQNGSSLASQYYVQYENGAKPTENLSRLITADRRGFRLNARLKQAPSLEYQKAFNRIRKIAEQEFPDIAGTSAQVRAGHALSTMSLTGKQYLFANMIHHFSHSLVLSMAIALLAITCLIMLIYRSVWIGLLSLIPNVLPLTIPLGLLGLAGIPIDGPSIIVVSVALGVCVDDTIHFLTRFWLARTQGADIPKALRFTFRNAGAPLTYTTLILVAGFAILTLSEFRPNKLIGQLGVIMIGLAWIADFVVTPAALSFLERRNSRSSEAVGEI